MKAKVTSDQISSDQNTFDVTSIVYITKKIAIGTYIFGLKSWNLARNVVPRSICYAKFYALSRTRTTKLWSKKNIYNNNENYKVHCCVDLMNKENGLFSSNERVILEIICYLMNNSYNFLVSKIVNSIYLYLKEWRNRRKMSKSKHHKSCEEINLHPQAPVNRTRNLLPTSLARAISPIW
jgi:hypothetical protein